MATLLVLFFTLCATQNYEWSNCLRHQSAIRNPQSLGAITGEAQTGAGEGEPDQG